VLLLEIIGAAIALGLLALHVGVPGRGMVAVLLAAAMVSMLLYVTFDLDRPTRGLIQVPDTSLAQLRASMNLPPAAATTHDAHGITHVRATRAPRKAVAELTRD
jgi:hypothetical protein